MAEQAHLAELRTKPIGYAEDYAAWVERQLMLLREHRFEELDVDNLIDEVSDLGKSEFRQFRSSIEVVLVRMLKWDHQPRRRSTSWQISIAEHRSRIAEELTDSPSYRSRQDEAVLSAYRTARFAAARETKLSLERFPTTCPYDWGAITSRDHDLPEDAARK